MTDEQKRIKAAIVAGAVAAFESAKRGDEHPRLNKMMERTERNRARQAAFYASFRPLRPFVASAPIESPYYHFTEDHYGTHGSVKAD